MAIFSIGAHRETDARPYLFPGTKTRNPQDRAEDRFAHPARSRLEAGLTRTWDGPGRGPDIKERNSPGVPVGPFMRNLDLGAGLGKIFDARTSWELLRWWRLDFTQDHL